MLAKKKEKQDRKPRNEYICGTTTGAISELTITVDQRTGEISFGSPMTNVYSEITYDRPKGPKVISRIPQSGAKLAFANHAAIDKNFDFLCAVDTNTRTIRGKQVSVVGIVTVTPTLIPGPNGLRTFRKFNVPFCLEFINLSVHPENFGWLAAWGHLSVEGKIDEHMKTGMIVDSDLGNLNSYNQRKAPLVGVNYLPPNVQLIYASGETARGNFVNKSLAIADSASVQTLDAVEQGIRPFNERPYKTPWFEGYRMVRVIANKVA